MNIKYKSYKLKKKVFTIIYLKNTEYYKYRFLKI